MLKKRIIFPFVLVVIIFGFSLHSTAGCKSECAEAYGSEVESCKETYTDPDDAETLRMCLDDAYSQFQSCYGECED